MGMKFVIEIDVTAAKNTPSWIDSLCLISPLCLYDFQPQIL